MNELLGGSLLRHLGRRRSAAANRRGGRHVGAEDLVNLLDPLSEALITTGGQVVHAEFLGELLKVGRSLGAEGDALDALELAVKLIFALLVSLLAAHLSANLVAEALHLALKLLVLGALSGVALQLALHALKLLNVAINALSVLGEAAALLLKILTVLSLLVLGFVEAADLGVDVLLVADLVGLGLVGRDVGLLLVDLLSQRLDLALKLGFLLKDLLLMRVVHQLLAVGDVLSNGAEPLVAVLLHLRLLLLVVGVELGLRGDFG